jgi:membrane protein DedA with SNARE-associated domain
MRVPPIPKWISASIFLGWLAAFTYFVNAEGRDHLTISLILGLAAVAFIAALFIDDRWFHARRRRKH